MTDVSTSVNDGVNTLVNAVSGQTLGSIVKCVAVLAAGILLIRLIMRLLNRAMENSHLLSAGLQPIVRNAVRITLYFVLLVAVAGIIGIPITSFVALFSIIGLALSLAIQGLLSNLAGSMIIAVAKPFKPGDFV